jgi:hypothetical protein
MNYGLETRREVVNAAVANRRVESNNGRLDGSSDSSNGSSVQPRMTASAPLADIVEMMSCTYARDRGK